LLSRVSLNSGKRDGIFSTHSLYIWLEFGGISNPQFIHTWKAPIPLKIKIFLWLVQQNRILTKDNLIKRRWQGDTKCIFCDEYETVTHLFIKCSIAFCLWSWICRYNNCNFSCNSIKELWYIDIIFPYKNSAVCELIRGAVI
jgi:zinc-binding in reverse transcriptase